MRNVGMIGIVNEPVQGSSDDSTLLSYFYPNAYNVRILQPRDMKPANRRTGHPQCGISPWHYLKQLPTCRAYERVVGCWKPQPELEQPCIHGIRRSPIPEVRQLRNRLPIGIS
jgi:hypothetical protein